MARKIIKQLGNKYILAILVFAGWLLFFDQNDYFTGREKQKELSDLRANISFMNREIKSMQKEYEALLTDPKFLEQYAREKYRMKKDNEDVYLFDGN